MLSKSSHIFVHCSSVSQRRAYRGHIDYFGTQLEYISIILFQNLVDYYDLGEGGGRDRGGTSKSVRRWGGGMIQKGWGTLMYSVIFWCGLINQTVYRSEETRSPHTHTWSLQWSWQSNNVAYIIKALNYSVILRARIEESGILCIQWSLGRIVCTARSLSHFMYPNLKVSVILCTQIKSISHNVDPDEHVYTELDSRVISV